MPKTSKVKKKVSKVKSKTSNKPKAKIITKSKEISKGPIKVSKTYIPKETEKYMCEKHKVFFRMKLQEWRKELIRSNNEALYNGSMDDKCGAHTIPYIEVKNPTAQLEHEATTSKVSDDQLFYTQQRGISLEDANYMIINGFCKGIFKELPFEFAIEASQLLRVSLEGTVG